MSQNHNIIRLDQVMKRTGLSRSGIYLKIKLGNFPKPINLGLRAVGWIENEVEDWIKSRVKESRPNYTY